jgi:drug/metabolite transporter (DMT)-like permease
LPKRQGLGYRGKRYMKSAIKQTPTSNSRAEAALIVLAVIWGTSHVITKSILTTHTPFFYTGLRFGLAAIVFALFFTKQLLRSSRKEVWQGSLLGLCSFAGISLYTLGLVFTNVSKAGFISGLYLVFTPLLAYLLFGALPTRDNLIGLLIALSGFALLSYPQSGAAFNWGDGLILAAAVAWGAHIAATSAFAQQSTVQALAAWQVIVVAGLANLTHFVLSPLAEPTTATGVWARLLAIEARPNQLTVWSFAQIGYMALLVTFVAALLQTWAQGKVASTHAALFYALEPVTAAVFAYLIFGEKLSWQGGVGAILIVTGITASRLGLVSKFARSRAAGQDEQSKAERAREYGD